MLNIGYRPIKKKKVSKACCFSLFFLYTLISVCRSVVNGESPLSLKLFTKLTDWEQRLTGSEDNDPPECLFFFNINVVSFLFWGAVLGPHCWSKLISSCAGWAYCSGLLLLWQVASYLWLPGSWEQAQLHKLSCSEGMQDLPAPDLHMGSNPCPLCWQAESSPLSRQGSPSCIFSPPFQRNNSPTLTPSLGYIRRAIGKKGGFHNQHDERASEKRKNSPLKASACMWEGYYKENDT